ncbi:MAG: GldG family protein [Treponema sp.]|nr:GldG family protein [Treponema sp.]
MTKKQSTTITILTIIAFILVVMVSSRLWFRLDITKNKTYTISAVVRNLHNEIPDQVRITYFVSDRLKAIHPLPGEIEDLLTEFAAFSRSKIRFISRDPVKSNMLQMVEQFGIVPMQYQTMDQDQSSIVTVYSGIVIEYLDQIDVLPMVFSRETGAPSTLETLEYDLTSRIRSMVRGSVRTLGIIVGDTHRRWDEDYQALQNSFMQAGYQTRLLTWGDEIPETLPALFVLGGVEGLNEIALYQIDRYIQTGGKVLFTVKGVHVETSGNMEARQMTDNGLLDMLEWYGVGVLPEIVLDTAALAMRYQTRTPSGMVQLHIVQNNQWIRVMRENRNPDHPVSANLSGLDLYWASPLYLLGREGVEAAHLFTSTGDAWAMQEPYYVSPEQTFMMDRDAQTTGGRKILGVSLSGIIPSFFADKPILLLSDEVELPEMPLVARPARIIIIGETDFATSFLGVTNGMHNLDFLVQAADWLSNDEDIIGIRPRTVSSERLDKITDPEQRSTAMRFARIINVFLVPLLVVFAGIFLALKRRAKSQLRAVIDRADEKEHQDGV